MDIELLSSLVRQHILEADEVVVPGLGAFVAQLVPASFSDRGFTVNPPYRQLSFVEEISPKGTVIEAEGLEECVEALKKELKEKREVEFPGLGKLRLTRGDEYLFVADPDIDIFPEGFGLEPVSMKNLEEEAPAEKSEKGEKGEKAEKGEKEEKGGEGGKGEAEKAEGGEKAVKAQPRAAKKKLPAAAVVAIVIIVIALLALVALRLLGTYAPDFIDRLLYSPEELEILKGGL